MKRATVYGCRDGARSDAEGQYYAEVVDLINGEPDSLDERVLYTTTWYTAPALALAEARAWMRDNRVYEVG